MMAFDGIVLWSAAVLALVGGASVTAALRCDCSSFRTAFQRLYTTCLVGVGATTMVALTLHNNCWLCCAIAYACLSVGGILDLGKANVTASF